ncbi:hypothetical protein ES703_86882 [subsurface metagenome]
MAGFSSMGLRPIPSGGTEASVVKGFDAVSSNMRKKAWVAMMIEAA